MNPISTRLLSASGAWLIDRGKKMCSRLFKDGRTSSRRLADKQAGRTGDTGPRYSTDREVLDGYVVEAKRAGNVGSVLVYDLPALLCLPGRYYNGSEFDPDNAFVQTLPKGRDTYLTGSVTAVLAPATDPLVLATAWRITRMAGVPTGEKLATRLWGSAQAFPGAGCMYGYGVVYLETPAERFALGSAVDGDEFAFRLNVFAPTYVRLQTVAGTQTLVPEEPTAAPASWSLEIPESVIPGATAFVRLDIDRSLVDEENEGIIGQWDVVQYPWLTFAPPRQFTDDDGNLGYKVHICAQVVFDEAGPYYVDPASPFYAWAEENDRVPSGARGLWVAEVQVLKGEARVLHQQTISRLEESDERRRPWRVDVGGVTPGVAYQGNVTYKATPVTLDSGTMVFAASSSTIRKTGTAEDPPTPPGEGYWLACEVVWMTATGLLRRQTLSTVEATRLLTRQPEGDVEYLGGVSTFDVNVADNRLVVGTATDGEVAVSIVFSSFRPGDRQTMRAVVSTEQAATVEYSGTPAFAMLMGSGGDETVSVGYADEPTFPDEQQFWTWMTSDNQVAYMGNGKYCFYCSTNWALPGPDAVRFVVSANLAMAAYDRKTRAPTVLGVIDPAFTSSGTTSGAPLTQLYFGRRLGNIEVLRKESDGYIPGEPGGHPAVLLVTRGRGAPAVTLQPDEHEDITQGQTWISYDSGATWVQMLQYGSPVGAFHCGNLVAPRTEPVVRI